MIAESLKPYAYALAVLLLLLSWIACGALGYRYRDARADAAVATQHAETETARADSVTAARGTDHANTQSATKVETGRVDAMAKHESNFHAIDTEVDRYANAHPEKPCPIDSARDASRDADFLRVWNDASQGSAGGNSAEPGRSAGAASGTATAPGAAHVDSGSGHPEDARGGLAGLSRNRDPASSLAMHGRIVYGRHDQRGQAYAARVVFEVKRGRQS